MTLQVYSDELMIETELPPPAPGNCQLRKQVSIAAVWKQGWKHQIQKMLQKKMKFTVELQPPMRQYLNEMQGTESGTRKKMKKSLDKLVTEVLQQPCFRVHYCIRSMQPIFMVLSQETSADADGSRIMEKVNQCISVGNTEQSDLVLGGKGEQPWDVMTVTFESITVKVMSSALYICLLGVCGKCWTHPSHLGLEAVCTCRSTGNSATICS